MEQMTAKLDRLVSDLVEVAKTRSKEEMEGKSLPTQWSKKEIIGHLIDSGINNLQRFSEIPFEKQPYQVRAYAQDDLVTANRYQDASLADLLALIKSLNDRIKALMQIQNEESLQLTVITPEGHQKNLEFLMQDYVHHFEHHIKQLKS